MMKIQCPKSSVPGRVIVLAVLAVGAAAGALAAGTEPAEALPPARLLGRSFGEWDAEAFRKPPKVFYPETWFHFIGGNVSREGLTADLEAVAEAGIEGVQLFHGQFGGPWPGVTNQIQCLSPEWDGLVRFAADECTRLGLRFSMQNCPGWSYAGGPWIAASNAMRQLVWRTAFAEGGKGVQTLALPEPAKAGGDSDYRDIAVIAYRAPEGVAERQAYPVAFDSNRPDFPWEKFFRGQKDGSLRCALGADPVWVEATYAAPLALRSVEVPSAQQMNHSRCYVPDVRVRVEAVLPDGTRRTVLDAGLPQSNWQGNRAVTFACEASESRTYRVSFSGGQDVNMSHVTLSAAPLKNNWEAEAGWVLGGLFGWPAAQGPGPRPKAETVGEVVDLTGKLAADGTLAWEVPPGRWLVQRWGHSNTGARNGPAPKEGTGWECDKLSRAGADAHFDGYIGRLSGKGGPLAGGLLKGLLTDSWECRTQTWTAGMDAEFKRRRGYALLPWFPALCGYVVGDEEQTARFLRDWRSCINDMLVENFYGRLAERARRNGLALSLETACGDVFPGDLLEYYKHADVPMCEFWQPRTEAFVGSLDFKPVKPCASAARLYGKPRVAAEAFTSFALTWNEQWEMLKDVANVHFAEGVSHLVFHTYTHNPRVGWLPPGTSFGSGIGTPFLRGQTWWRHMPEFTAYLARCGYLLERGRPVSDVLLYLGDEQDAKPPQALPDFPEGYAYDYCNPDVLLNRLAVRDGRLVTPEGLEYRVLWLRDCKRMLPETLEKVAALVKKGATVVGGAPQGLATLSGGGKAQARFDAAVQALWGGPGGRADRRVGKGRVMAGVPVGDALARIEREPDVAGGGVVWCHRAAQGADWYFVAAKKQGGFKGTLAFRSTGRVELWDPVTGAAGPAGVAARDGAVTRVALDLPPSGAAFVIFRRDEKPLPTVLRVERDGQPVWDARKTGGAAAEPVAAVLSARYGDLGREGRWIDVSERVRAALAKGERDVTASNGWAGGDPALGTPKRFEVVLRRLDGSEVTQTCDENRTVRLAEERPASAPPCEVLDGGRALLAWENGRYTLGRADGGVETVEARAARRVPLAGPWTLAFPPGWGAPAELELAELKAWKDLDIGAEGRAFSGTARYTRDFDLGDLPEGGRVELDLGRVAMIAAVSVNGQAVGTVWAPPYRLDITRAVRPGANRLAVDVTGTWFNRLAYDAGAPEAERKTWTINGPKTASALQPSGLLGPVAVRVGSRSELAE